MILDIAVLRNDKIKRIVPIGFFLLLCYVDVVSFYFVGYCEIYHQSRGVAICLWTIISILQVLVLFYWFLIFFIGPGKVPKIQPFDIYNSADEAELPTYFECDENGYPFYCSTCQSIKPFRSFHSKDMKCCILKFDHYCSWIGTAIGESNYIAFLKYILLLVLQHITHIIFTACYTRQNMSHGSINLNFVALFIISIFVILLTFTLFISQLRYIALNRTTLDDITRNQAKRYHAWKLRNTGKKIKSNQIPRKENGIRFINIKHNNIRVVIKYGIMYDNFNMGFKKNFINLIYNFNRNSRFLVHKTTYSNKVFLKSIIIFITPLIELSYIFCDIGIFDFNDYILPENIYTTYEFHTPVLSQQFTDYLDSQIEKGNYTIPSYLVKNEMEDTLIPSNESNLYKEDIISKESSNIV